jgi:hypothetical protein
MRHLVGFSFGLAMLTVSAFAGASATFPAEVQSALNMPCTPPCTICHKDNLGGIGTVTKPFGSNMIDVGHVKRADPSSVKPALDALDAAKTDSDGDGVSDIDELRAGDDPNTKGANNLCSDVPMYGCGARVAPNGRLDGWAAVAAFATAAALLARMRRR